MRLYVIDSEGDGLKPTKIYCLSVCDPKTGRVFTATTYDQMRRFFEKADVIVGHNLIRFDVPVFERILGIKIKCKVVDSLALSWYLYPQRAPRTHGLAWWGEEFGVPKPVVEDWDNLPLETYIHRCEEDVKINTKLWKKQLSYLLNIYGSKEKLWRFLDYLEKKMYCTRLQEESRWKLDIPFVKEALEKLEKLKEEKFNSLREAMPKVPITTIKTKPKRFINKDGTFSKYGQEWIALLTEQGLPPDHEEPVTIVKDYEPGNPNSTDQLKSWLDSFGWKPQTFKYVKDSETGETRAIPQINQEHGKGICPSIVALYDKEPNLEYIDGLGVVSHRISILSGFLDAVSSDGFVIAKIAGLTNTLRFKHSELVNLPKVEKAYGEYIRGSLVSREGKILCGSDMASLEDRIKQSFIYPLDPDYVDSMNQEDFDPHLIIAVLAGMLTQEQSDAYKAGEKKYKPVRDIAKNGNYACQYGAGPPRLMLTCNIDLKAATALHSAYWKLNWAIKKVAEMQTYKSVDNQMWLFNPVSEFWYSLRYVKDVFSTLVQGTASYVFDLWVFNILEERPQLTGQFHDEVCLEIAEGAEEKCKELVMRAIDKTNKQVKLNRKLDVSIQFGKRYSDIH